MARISARGKIVRIQSNDDMQKHSAESRGCPAEAQVTSPDFSNSRESFANSRLTRQTPDPQTGTSESLQWSRHCAGTTIAQAVVYIQLGDPLVLLRRIGMMRLSA